MIDPWTWWRTSGVLVAIFPRGAGAAAGRGGQILRLRACAREPLWGAGGGVCYWDWAEQLHLAHPAIRHDSEPNLVQGGWNPNMFACLKGLAWI